MKFTLLHTDNKSKARAGLIETSRGSIETPIFMPVGTAGTVKGVHQRELENEVNAPVILGNTYHLYLRPGTDVIEKAGGLHKFMGWDRLMLTDSGGYQVFSLNEIRKIKEEGTEFRSYIDGSKHMFTPENVMDIQRSIGADIIMAFDECTSYPSSPEQASRSMELTHRWLTRCINRFDSTEEKYGHSQYLFPIVQGSMYPELRKKSAEFIAEQNLEGNAIGGLSVGEPAELMYEMTDLVTDILPANKPRYLMGVGTPANLLECIALGIDMFDCVLPTRNARHGHLFTPDGIINIRNAKWRYDFSPISSGQDTFLGQYYTKAYLKHLLQCDELLGYQIASLHNLSFYLWLIREARMHILEGDFMEWKKEMVVKLAQRL